MALIAISFHTHAQDPSKQMEEFLAFDRKSQDGFIGNGIVMIGVIAAQTQPEIARCIDDWYLADKAGKAEKRQMILNTMRRFSKYAPQAIILAVVEKKCGKFKRAN